MRFFEGLFGGRPQRRPQTREEKIAYAIGIIKDVGSRLDCKYDANNTLKYLAIYAAGEYIRESLETGDFEIDTDYYPGSKCETRLRKHLEIGINNLVTHGLNPGIANAKIRSRFSDFEKIALYAAIEFVSINRKKKPDPPAFLTALRIFYDLSESEMRKGFRKQ